MFGPRLYDRDVESLVTWPASKRVCCMSSAYAGSKSGMNTSPVARQAALQRSEHRNQELLQQLQQATEALAGAQLRSQAQDRSLQAMEDRSNRLQQMLESLR